MSLMPTDEDRAYERGYMQASNGASAELTRLTALVAEQQRQIEEIQRDRDSLRKALDDRHDADKRAWKAIMRAAGRERGVPSNKEVVAYYIAENERLEARIAELERVNATYAKRLCDQNDILNELRPVRESLTDANKRIAELEKERDEQGRNACDLFDEAFRLRGALNAAETKFTTLQSSARQMKEALERIKAGREVQVGDHTEIADRPDIDEIVAAALQSAASIDLGTPGAKWRENGEPDPHGTRYNRERAALVGGQMTDDELANAVFMEPSIANLTAAKDRIRWLSRQLSAPSDIGPDWRKDAGKLAEAAEALSEFAWSAVSADCDESRQYLSELLASLRAAIADFNRAKGGDPTL
jgi:myosin heavy subunit